MPICWRILRSFFGGTWVRFWFSKRTSPLSGFSSSLMHLRRVLFPAPLRPMMPTIEPCGMDMLTLLRAMISFFFKRKRLFRFLSSMMGVEVSGIYWWKLNKG